MKHLGSLIMYCIPQQHHHNITKTRFHIIIFVFFGFVKKLLSSNTPYNFSASYKAILYFVFCKETNFNTRITEYFSFTLQFNQLLI